MNIIIPKTHSIRSGFLSALEAAYGTLPASYKDFLAQHDGAKPEENIFRVDERRNAGVERFIPAAEILHIRDAVDGFPKNMLPFAEAAGGNLIYLDPANGAVHFWDHEIDSGDAKVANSFDQFLSILDKFDIDRIKLKSSQVKKVMVNPNFKPKF